MDTSVSTTSDHHISQSSKLSSVDLNEWMELALTQTSSSEMSVLEMSCIDNDTVIGTVSSSIQDLDQTAYSTPTTNLTKLGRFIATIFPTSRESKWLEPETYFLTDTDWISVWCGQFEICPSTNTLHAHIYIESVHNKRKRFDYIRDKLSQPGAGCNIRAARKSTTEQRQGAVNYVLMPSKRAADTEAFVWHGNKLAVSFDPTFLPQKKKRSRDEDDEAKRQWIESKPRFWTWDQIVHESDESKRLLYSCAWGDKYHKGRHAADKRRTITNIIILYGAGGTGKTTMAHAWGAVADECDDERYYRRNPDDGAFWGGGRTSYKGQRIIHYEEFTGQETFSRLKEVCDIGKQGPAVNVKNGGSILNHDTVVFTSNVHPSGWFHHLWAKDPKQFHPFWRRVTKVFFFPSHRPDGTMSIPDCNNPPHYIDQTNEWVTWQGSYDNALEHAKEHWPLQLEEPPQPMLLVQGDKHTRHSNFYQYCQTGIDKSCL